jgi:spermidine synthase
VWLFLVAYTCSGAAGLIYEVSWTRQLTLYIGHSTAAASAVVAAFMGGLALGAIAGGRFASRLTPRQCFLAYAVLEAIVVVVALALPFELKLLTPVLRWSYEDGAPGLLFPAIRLFSCMSLMLVPSLALGATFPIAVRCTGDAAWRTSLSAGALYTANTAGAAAGALVAGFVLIPAIGVSGSILVGVASSALASSIALVLWITRRGAEEGQRASHDRTRRSGAKRSKSRVTTDAAVANEPVWLAAVVLGLTGFSSLVFEIVWTRVLALIIGPTTYAFAATLATLILGLAVGAAIGSWIASRSPHRSAWLGFALAYAAAAAAWTSSIAGDSLPRYIANEIAQSPGFLREIHTRGAMFVAALILPTAAGFGAAFPLALATVAGDAREAVKRLGLAYAVNTIGAVAGSLAAGFVLISMLGLQHTLELVSALLILTALIVLAWATLGRTGQIVNGTALVLAVVALAWSPPWDRALLASGLYLYAPYVPKDVALEPLLKAGSILYYKEGAAATVSVKRLTGTLSLAIDGKVDASNRSDMLTQKLVAHLPLLIHGNPREVAIIGLGSGVTLASALTHPIAHADVVELVPEVVEASKLFEVENRRALADSRTRLIVGDGRSHLMLSKRQYDVIISEPSNPWIAGVAALFTREFFEATRERLAPGGILCQWAHTYNISDRDLRSIAATFTSVFPDTTVWLIGESDILFVASTSPIDGRLANVERGWATPDVNADLRESLAVEPFALLSLYAGGPSELKTYGEGATILTDDRMMLEFSGPGDLESDTAAANSATVSGFFDAATAPPVVRRAHEQATAAMWRDRGAMMFKSDAHGAAYDNFERALALDPADARALEGLGRAAIPGGRTAEALTRIDALSANTPRTPAMLVTRSKLLAARGSADAALEAAKQAAAILPVQASALEQLASLHADAGNRSELDAVVASLQKVAPDHAATWYYAGASAFLDGRFDDTLRQGARALSIDREYAPVYDLIGAAHTKLNQPEKARQAFESSLRFDAHDSSAYANLGLLALTAGERDVAANYFAEALWLDSNAKVARDGLAAALSR